MRITSHYPTPLGLILAFFCFIFSHVSSSAEEAWLKDMDTALKTAQAEGKDILILYRGNEFHEAHGNHPGPLFYSPHFTEAARKNYILVDQNMPSSTVNDSGTITTAVFCDLQGIPYYSFNTEWHMGMDWVLEELNIASERKPVIQKILNSMENRSLNVPEASFARQLFSSIPVKIEKFYPPYQQLLKRTLKDGHEDGKKLKQHLENSEQIDLLLENILNTIPKLKNAEEIESLLQSHHQEIKRFPIVHQWAVFALHSSRITQDILSEYHATGNELEAINNGMSPKAISNRISPIIAVSPHSKMSRYLRTHVIDGVCALQSIISVHGIYKTDPERALQLLNKNSGSNTSYAYRQVYQLLRGRLLAEQGKWNDARQSLQQSISLDPISRNAKVAEKLLQSISGNCERLENLLPLKRKGNENIDREWDTLLGMDIRSEVFFNSLNYDQYF